MAQLVMKDEKRRQAPLGPQRHQAGLRPRPNQSLCDRRNAWIIEKYILRTDFFGPFLDQKQEFRGRQGIAAQVEKIVTAADPVDPQAIAEASGDGGLQG
jgi:hypothetical protein